MSGELKLPFMRRVYPTVLPNETIIVPAPSAIELRLMTMKVRYRSEFTLVDCLLYFCMVIGAVWLISLVWAVNDAEHTMLDTRDKYCPQSYEELRTPSGRLNGVACFDQNGKITRMIGRMSWE